MNEKELREAREALAALEARKSALSPLTETAEDKDIEEREQELNAIAEERKALTEKIAELEKVAEETKAVEERTVRVEEIKEERKTMTVEELRNSAEYAKAYAEYVKTGKDDECRSVLSVNASSGEVPVPTSVETKIQTAWDNEEITKRVSKSFVKGNLTVGFEVSGTDAVIHVEGENAPDEETLVIGRVSLIPKNLKKWITISDEVMELTGQEFLDYIYDEIAYKIAKLAADTIVGKIVALPQSYPATISEDDPAIPIADKITVAPSATTIAQAYAHLSDEASEPVVIMNKLTYATFKAITTADGYALADPFDGLPVLFNNSLDSYDDADAGEIYAIVGDLRGVRANFPNGENVTFKFDDLSLAEADLVKVVGKEFVALEVIAPKRFTLIAKDGTVSA